MKSIKLNYAELAIIDSALELLIDTASADANKEKHIAYRNKMWQIVREYRELGAKIKKMKGRQNENQTVARFQSWNHKYEIDEMLDQRTNDFREYDIFDVTTGKPGKCVGHLTVASEVDPSENEDRRYLIKEAKAEIASLNLE